MKVWTISEAIAEMGHALSKGDKTEINRVLDHHVEAGAMFSETVQSLIRQLNRKLQD